MFQAMARRKNSYLHKSFKDIEPRILNRSVNAAMERSNAVFDLNPPLLESVALQPTIFGPNLDHTKAELAYGAWGIPKLVKDLHDDDIKIRLCSLNTLCVELRNPEKCFTAANKCYIIKRLTDILCTLVIDDETEIEYKYYYLERILLVFRLLAGYLDIAIKIYAETEVVKVFYALVIDSTDCICVSLHAINVLAVLSSHQKIADQMVQDNHFEYVLISLENISTIFDTYVLLSNLIERYPTEALEYGYFEFLLQRITVDSPCQSIQMNCFAELIQCEKAQSLCDSADAIPKLIIILKCDEIYDKKTYEYAAMALHNCLLNTKSRWLAREYWELPMILIRHAHSKTNERLQMHALQCLRQLSEMPSIKEFAKRVCKRKIKNICCNNSIMTRQRKKSLLRWLRFSKFRSGAKNIHVNDTEDKDSIVTCTEPESEEINSEKSYYPYRVDPHPVVPKSSRSSVDTNYLMEKYLK